MASTLQAETFADINLRERSALDQDVATGATALVLESNQGIAVGQTIFVGMPAREGCESAVVQTLTGSTNLTVNSVLKYAHSRFEPVTAVLGGYIHIYRAVNVNDSVPDDSMFSVLATRTIDPDQQSTYYTDSSGGSGFWYKLTYFDPATNTETALSDAVPVRGSDFGHYASISEIRLEAGFKDAVNLSDVLVDQQRRATESDIHAALGNAYTVPFKPVPDFVHTVTIQLAAALLLVNVYGSSGPGGDRLKAARLLLTSLMNRDQGIPGVDAASSGISFWPGDCEPRSFTMSDRL